MGEVYKVNRSDMVTVADAIRTKVDTTEQLIFPSGFVVAINGIETGKTGATLAVTTPSEGVTVTITKGEISYTKTSGSDRTVSFYGLETGTWTVTITDGVQTAQKTVDINADYETFITFFSSTIQITYPSGLSCTATDGSTTLRAPDTSGVWACVVHNAGTWTVTVEQKGWTDTVNITESGQTVQVALDQLYIYRNGILKYDIQDGFKNAWKNSGDKLIGHSDASASGYALILGFKDKIIGVDIIYVRAKVINFDNTGYYVAFLSNYNTWPNSYNNKLASVNIESPQEKTYSIDVSSISGDIYLWFAWSATHHVVDVEIYEIRGA